MAQHSSLQETRGHTSSNSPFSDVPLVLEMGPGGSVCALHISKCCQSGLLIFLIMGSPLLNASAFHWSEANPGSRLQLQQQRGGLPGLRPLVHIISCVALSQWLNLPVPVCSQSASCDCCGGCEDRLD